MELFSNQSSNPTTNAQKNLMGRTHFVDPETLKFHKSRVISARSTDNGLLFAIVTSDALDFENSRRGFRYTLFDLFGTVISRIALEDAFRTSQQAEKAMWAALNATAAKSVTWDAIQRRKDAFAKDMAELESTVTKLGGFES